MTQRLSQPGRLQISLLREEDKLFNIFQLEQVQWWLDNEQLGLQTNKRFEVVIDRLIIIG